MRLMVPVVCTVIMLVLPALVLAETVQIQVAPATIVLKAPCPHVTIHAEMPYSSVADNTVQINGLDADATFPDDCGNLVARIAFEKITALVEPPEAQITLTGMTEDGVQFEGMDTVRVK